jgi:hypothetical protein
VFFSFSLATVRSNSLSIRLRSVMSMMKPSMCCSRLTSTMSAETSTVWTVPWWVRNWHSTSRTEPLRLRSAQNLLRALRFAHKPNSQES